MTNKPYGESRDWRRYNEGQVRELELFDLLLTDLVRLIEEPKQRRCGRPAVPTTTLVWAAVKKLYTGFSSRRNQGYVLDAEQMGLIRSAPRYNAVSDFLNKKETEVILQDLIVASAVPLASIEEDFAVDSTGFACGAYGTYLQTRYEDESRKRKFIKLHACVGTRFNVVTAAVATPGNANDSPFFRPLVLRTGERFRIASVSADKAYSSFANHLVVEEAGGQPLIPFRSITNPGASKGHGPEGRAWRRAYHFFSFEKEEFYRLYHKRSNAEATFSAIKTTLGERLKSKRPLAQRNEVLCKVIAWNIRCVARAVVEIGLTPDYLQGTESDN